MVARILNQRNFLSKKVFLYLKIFYDNFLFIKKSTNFEENIENKHPELVLNYWTKRIKSYTLNIFMEKCLK